MESTRTLPENKKKLTTADMARTENALRADEHRRGADGDWHDGEDTSTRIAQKQEASTMHDEKPTPLLAEDRAQDFRARWQAIQVEFVDEPRKAVEKADELVAETMQQLAQSFSDQRSRLESDWGHSEKASTEDLRLALRRYRSFFDRLLSF